MAWDLGNDVDDEALSEDGKEVLDIKVALGGRLTQHIRDLHAVQSIPIPDTIVRSPRPLQLPAAGRLRFLYRSLYRGGILREPLGLGKTFSAILLLLFVPGQPDKGPMLIVTKQLVRQARKQENFRDSHLKPTESRGM